MIMLVLRRCRGQSIVIGINAEIVVKILREDKGVISVGIDAPRTIQVDRLEVFQKRQSNDPIERVPEELPLNKERVC
jgi:carbon storage regulator